MDVSRLCSALVRIRSENPPGDTQGVIEYLFSYLDTLGVHSKMVEGEKGRWNLVSFPSPEGVLFCGHVDVVPARQEGWSHDPFSGDIEGEFVWGRGSSDMKGGCAAILSALETLLDEGRDPPVNLAFVCDEETGGRSGIRHLLAHHHIRSGDCIVAEPTPLLNPSVGQKGLCRMNITFDGVPGHASLHPIIGRSAIMDAVRFIEYLQALHRREYRVDGEMGALIDRSAEVLGSIFGVEGVQQVLTHITFNPGVIRGGEKVNIIAQHCHLELDLRIPWGCRVDSLVEKIRNSVPNGRLQIVDCSDPNITSPEEEIVQTLCSEIERACGKAPQPIVQWAASDAKFLRKAGFQVVEYGPGDLTTLHGVDERVPISALETAADIYAGVMRRYRGKKKIRDIC
ncbi:MAG: M20/M25/M40 family metallo-hydrolase [Methanomicrobiales archaeon]|nr:M20/M25/M40 family metallo-hydrolase [Methanomicrobiales archaeon]